VSPEYLAMIQELIRHQGAEVNGLLTRLRLLGKQRKMVMNSSFASDRVVSQQVDVLQQLVLSTPELNSVDLVVTSTPVVQVLDAGGNDLVNLRLKTAQELRFKLNKHLIDIDPPTGDGTDFDDYLDDVSPALTSKNANWITSYGRGDSHDQDRWENFLRRLNEALMAGEAETKKVVLGQINDHPAKYKLSLLIPKIVNPSVLSLFIAEVNTITQLSIKLGILGLVPRIYEASVRGQIDTFISQLPPGTTKQHLQTHMTNLVASALKAQVTSVVDSLCKDEDGGSRNVRESLENLLLNLPSSTVNDQIKDVVISLLLNQYSRDAVDQGLDDVDSNSSDTNDALSNLLSRQLLEQETDDWESPAGLELIRQRIVERVRPVSDQAKLLADVDSYEGRTTLLPDEPQCGVLLTSLQKSNVRAAVTAKLRGVLDADSPAQVAVAQAAVLNSADNASLAVEVNDALSKLGTEDDPLNSFLSDVNAGLVSADIDAQVDTLEAVSEELFQSLSPVVDPHTKDLISHLLGEHLDTDLSLLQIQKLFSESMNLLNVPLARTHRLTLISWLDVLAYAKLTPGLRDYYNARISELVPEDQLERVQQIVQVLSPSLVDVTALRSELLALPGIVALTGSQVLELNLALDALVGRRPVNEERGVLSKVIVDTSDLIPVPHEVQRFLEICHILLGDVLGEASLEALRSELQELTDPYMSGSDYDAFVDITAMLLDKKIQGVVRTLAIDSAKAELSTLTDNRLTRVNTLVDGLPDLVDMDSRRLDISEILFFFDEETTNSSNNRVAIERGMDRLLNSELGLTTHNSLVHLTRNLVTGSGLPSGDISTLDANVVSVSSNQVASVYTNRKLALLQTLIPSDLHSQLTVVKTEKDRLKGLVDEVDLFPSVATSTRQSIVSVVKENRERRRAVVNAHSNAVNNRAPKARIFRECGTGVSLFYSGSKYAVFGGDRLLNKMQRVRSAIGGTVFKVYNKVNRIVHTNSGKVLKLVGDLRNKLQLDKLRSTILKTAGMVNNALKNILCILDFLHDMIKILNGIVADVIAGLRGIIASINAAIASIKAALASLFRSLGRLGNIALGAQCSCFSFNFRFNLGRSFLDDIADWICDLNLKVPDIFAGLSGPFLDPKLGCPQNLIAAVRGQTGFLNRGFQGTYVNRFFAATGGVRPL
jgi:hypothetical protein